MSRAFWKEATLLLQAIRYHSVGEDWPAATSMGLVFFCTAYSAPTLQAGIGKNGIMIFLRIRNTKQLKPRHLV